MYSYTSTNHTHASHTYTILYYTNLHSGYSTQHLTGLHPRPCRHQYLLYHSGHWAGQLYSSII